jgi:hypothetical protein
MKNEGQTVFIYKFVFGLALTFIKALRFSLSARQQGQSKNAREKVKIPAGKLYKAKAMQFESKSQLAILKC